MGIFSTDRRPKPASIRIPACFSCLLMRRFNSMVSHPHGGLDRNRIQQKCRWPVERVTGLAKYQRFRGFFGFGATGHHFSSYMTLAPRGTRLFSRYNLDLNIKRPLCTRSSSISSGMSPSSSRTISPCSLNQALPRMTNEPGSARGFCDSGNKSLFLIGFFVAI